MLARGALRTRNQLGPETLVGSCGRMVGNRKIMGEGCASGIRFSVELSTHNSTHKMSRLAVLRDFERLISRHFRLQVVARVTNLLSMPAARRAVGLHCVTRDQSQRMLCKMSHIIRDLC